MRWETSHLPAKKKPCSHSKPPFLSLTIETAIRRTRTTARNDRWTEVNNQVGNNDNLRCGRASGRRTSAPMAFLFSRRGRAGGKRADKMMGSDLGKEPLPRRHERSTCSRRSPPMSMPSLAYARLAFQLFSRSARHIYQLIASHQNPETGWAYLSYGSFAKESSLTPRRVMQLQAFLEANHALEVRRGHGRGHVNFTGSCGRRTDCRSPTGRRKKVKSGTAFPEEKVKFPTPPEPEKVKSQPAKPLESLGNHAR